MEKFLTNFLFQVIVFIAVVYLFGFLISLLNRLFYRCVNHNRIVCYATGFIGTPIHELSHAFMCLIFFHKINEIKLFQIDEETGVMGYVNHSFNRRNIYHVLGNYLIGVAPIICGAFILFFLSQYFIPNTFDSIVKYADSWSLAQNTGSVDVLSYLLGAFEGIFTVFLSELSFTNLSLVFLVIAFCLCLHMNLSGADIKGSITSVPLWILLFAIVNAVLCFIFGGVYDGFLNVMYLGASYLICTMIISLILSIAYVVVTVVIRLIISGIGLIFRR